MPQTALVLQGRVPVLIESPGSAGTRSSAEGGAEC